MWPITGDRCRAPTLVFGLQLHPIAPTSEQEVDRHDDGAEVLLLIDKVRCERRQQEEPRCSIPRNAENGTDHRADHPSCDEQADGDQDEPGVLPQQVHQADGQCDGNRSDGDEEHHLAEVALHLWQSHHEVPETVHPVEHDEHLHCGLLRVRLRVKESS